MVRWWTNSPEKFLTMRDELHQVNRAGLEDLASILYTLESAGTPKGVMMSHRVFIFDATCVWERSRIVLPMFSYDGSLFPYALLLCSAH
jgi:long-subunit acyl-CoA synthetase (AMP-forming)